MPALLRVPSLLALAVVLAGCSINAANALSVLLLAVLALLAIAALVWG